MGTGAPMTLKVCSPSGFGYTTLASADTCHFLQERRIVVGGRTAGLERRCMELTGMSSGLRKLEGNESTSVMASSSVRLAVAEWGVITPYFRVSIAYVSKWIIMILCHSLWYQLIFAPPSEYSCKSLHLIAMHPQSEFAVSHSAIRHVDTLTPNYSNKKGVSRLS